MMFHHSNNNNKKLKQERTGEHEATRKLNMKAGRALQKQNTEK